MKAKFLKTRYIAAALPVIVSILITPACIGAAYRFRGYRAFGGEYLVVPMGIALAYILLETAKAWDAYNLEFARWNDIFADSDYRRAA